MADHNLNLDNYLAIHVVVVLSHLKVAGKNSNVALACPQMINGLFSDEEGCDR